MNRNRATKVVAIAVLLFLGIGAYFMVNVELPPWSHWLSGLNVVLFAVPAFWVTRYWLGWRDAGLLWLTLGVYALLVETSAIHTGFPYGHFGYSELLGAKLFGTTPWTVVLAWTPLILGAYGIAANLVDRWFFRTVVTALIATSFDLVLDPGAVRLGFWHYAEGGWWYGVPWSNFAGWLITSAVAATLIELYLIWRRPLSPTPLALEISSGFIVAFWMFVAIFAGYYPVVVVASFTSIVVSYIRWRGGSYLEERLVLCDESGRPIATMPKADVHTADTPLHLAFSIFLFNSNGELLLQCRSHKKKTWPGVWSNSCCGHQMLNFPVEYAAKRRLAYELGIKGVRLHSILPDYRYRAEKDGVVENEICPVFVGFIDAEPKPNLDEVESWLWQEWEQFLADIRSPETPISPWAVEEAELLAANDEFQRLFAANTHSA